MLRVKLSAFWSAAGSRARSFCSIAEAHLRLLVEQIPLFFWTTDSIARHVPLGTYGKPARSFPRYPVGQTIYQYLRCRDDGEVPVKQHFLALNGFAPA